MDTPSQENDKPVNRYPWKGLKSGLHDDIIESMMGAGTPIFEENLRKAKEKYARKLAEAAARQAEEEKARREAQGLEGQGT